MLFLISPLKDIREEVMDKVYENFYYSKDDNILVTVDYLGKNITLFDQSKFEYLDYKQWEMSINLWWAKKNGLSIKDIETVNKLSEQYMQLIHDKSLDESFQIESEIKSILDRCSIACKSYI